MSFLKTLNKGGNILGMKRTLLLFISIILGLQGNLFGQPLVLDYLDGSVEVQTRDNAWKALAVGESVEPDAVLRISDSGLAELSQGALKLHLGKDGTYQMSKSLAQAKQKPNSNIMGLTGSQVSMLLGTKSHSGVAVANMGARGAAKSDEEGMAWAGDESLDANAPADPLVTIKAQMDQKDWTGALKSTNAALSAQSADRKALLFDKALILSNLGLASGSLKALADADLQPNDAQYLEAALLVGSLGVETEDYDLVLTKTDEALQLAPEKGVSQNLKLAQALAWKGKGDSEKSKSLLNDVVQIEPQSGPGQEASRLLAN